MLDHEKITLNEEELAGVNGGVRATAATAGTNSQDKSYATKEHKCPHCERTTVFKVYSGGRGVCTVCGRSTMV